MQVITYDPFIQPEILLKKGIEPVSLEELYRGGLHYYSYPKDERYFRPYQWPGYFQDERRGDDRQLFPRRIIDEKALFEGLKSGKVAGAALDVL